MPSEKPTQGQPAHNTERKSSKTRDHADDPVPSVSASIQSQPEKTYRHCEITCKAEKNWWDKTKPFVETFGVILLLAYTAYTIRMFYVNRDAANAATSAAKTAKDTLTVSEKAFVYAKDASIVWEGKPPSKKPHPKPSDTTFVMVAFRNSGLTMARNASAGIGALSGPGIRSDFNWPISVKAQPVLIAPQSENSLGMQIPTIALLAAELHQTNIFIYGEISYQDVFAFS